MEQVAQPAFSRRQSTARLSRPGCTDAVGAGTPATAAAGTATTTKSEHRRADAAAGTAGLGDLGHARR